MAQKVEALRSLAEEVGLASQADLAERWGITVEAVRQLMSDPAAPKPVYESARTRIWPLPDAERHRSIRLQRAGKRGGRRS
jgi:predicted dehydrogenase